MTDPRGFLKFERRDRTYLAVDDRLDHYHEFTVPLENGQLHEQGSRCMDCGIPFCHMGCPVDNIIPDWNALVAEDKWQDAIAVLHSTNNFPEFTGRLCPAPCETSCVLGINAEPVTIKQIELEIVERAWADGGVLPLPPQVRPGWVMQCWPLPLASFPLAHS